MKNSIEIIMRTKQTFHNFIYILVLALFFKQHFGQDITLIETDVTIQSDFKVNSLKIHQEKGVKPEILLEADKINATIKADDKNLTISQNGKNFIDITPKSLKTPPKTSFYQGVDIGKDLVVEGKRQWLIAYRTDFDNFNDEVKYKCGAYNILGGYCISSKKELRQKFILPKHSMVRLRLNFFFLDAWNGETGYIKVTKLLIKN